MSRFDLPSVMSKVDVVSGQRGHRRWPQSDSLLMAAFLLLLAAFLALALRLLGVGSADLNIAGLFSTDEQLAGQLVRAMVQQHNLGLSHFFSYGPLDLYAARLLLWPYGLVRSVNDQAILVALRLVSLMAGAGCLLLTYLLGRRLWSPTVGLLAAVLLALSPTVFAWSTTAHPDSLQLLFLLLGLRLTVELPAHRSRATLLLASCCAALAFAAKYGGIFLLPVIWLAAGTGDWRQGSGNTGPSPGTGSVAGEWAAIKPAPTGVPFSAHTPVSFFGPRWRTWLGDAVLSGAVFVLVFLLIDPSVLSEPRRFISQARMESELAHSGHLFAAVASPAGWLRLLGGGDLLGPVGLLLGLGGLLVWTSFDLFRSGSSGPTGAATDCGSTPPLTRSPQSPARLPLAAWTMGYLLLLLVWVADRQPRYALPVLPGLALYAGATIPWLTRRLPLRRLGIVLLLLAAAVPLGARLVTYERAQARRMDDPSITARVAAGRWLAGEVGAGTPILYDAYAYLPPSFKHGQETFGLTRAQIDAFRPQIILSDAEISGRFRDPAQAGSYHDGAAVYRGIAATYAALEAGTLPCYPLLRDFGSVRIYGRIGDGSC